MCPDDVRWLAHETVQTDVFTGVEQELGIT